MDMWQAFDQNRGNRQKLPPERRYVLLAINAVEPLRASSVVVGYIKFAAGDKHSPVFVLPGISDAHLRRVVYWCDCLGDTFTAPSTGDTLKNAPTKACFARLTENEQEVLGTDSYVPFDMRMTETNKMECLRQHAHALRMVRPKINGTNIYDKPLREAKEPCRHVTL